MADQDSDRCWPGYEPVPGKPEHSEGSCRKSAPSKTTKAGKTMQAKREKQLDAWQKKHPGSPRQAAQHLPAPASAKKTSLAKKKSSPAKKKAAAKK